MRIVIAGAGAIGGYIGAHLARVGADVVLYARGPHLRAMQERGLRVVSDEGEFLVRPNATGDLSAIGQADVVFLGVKAHGLTALAPQLRVLYGPDTVVVSTQNGIPWWYFQQLPGDLNGLRLERVDPGGVIAANLKRAASSGRWPTSRPTSSSRASSGTARGTGSASGSRTGRGRSGRARSPRP